MRETDIEYYYKFMSIYEKTFKNISSHSFELFTKDLIEKVNKT